MKCKGYFKQFKESLTEEQIRAVRMSTEKIAEKLDGENVPDTNAGKNDRWIPVTERLPEEGENVLGWIERDKWDNFDKPTKAEECAIG